MRKTRNIDFTENKEKKAGNRIIALLTVGVVLAGVISFIVLFAINDFDPQQFLHIRAAEETTVEESTERVTEEITTLEAFSDENLHNFLLMCYSDEKEVIFCDVISVSQGENVIRVKPVSTELTLEYQNASYTLQKLYELFSIGAVRDAVAQKGISVDRYVGLSETNFKMLMQKLGPVDITVETDVSFSVDAIKYSYDAGIHSMTSDALLKYMKYASSGEEKLDLQVEAVAEILREYLTTETINRGEDFFSDFINLADSDITAFDYAGMSEEICAFLEKKPPVKAVR